MCVLLNCLVFFCCIYQRARNLLVRSFVLELLDNALLDENATKRIMEKLETLNPAMENLMGESGQQLFSM